jgi:two-component system CheB/CheR fusion protein
LLRERTKHDLTQYKPSTLTRRIERRMGVHGLGTLAEYEDYVRINPAELDLLFREILIGVTGFFRDPAVWQELEAKVLPALLARRTPERRLRAWVVGCSTGEEAYSLAIVIKEAIDRLGVPDPWALQIFATDLSSDAIAFARKGHYPRAVADAVGPARLGRFFRADGEGLLISKEIRDMVLFAQHDVILDPPFTKLDFVSCRNVMIYFGASLQNRLLKLFHYALSPGGVLALGESETVGRALRLFAPLHPKWRLFQRSDSDGAAVDFPVQPRFSRIVPTQESSVTNPMTGHPNLQTLADQLMLREFAPPAVLVNEHGDVIYVSGRTARYLEAAAGKANWNIHVMARPAIRVQLAVALRQAALEKRSIELRGLALEDPLPGTIDVTIQPIEEPGALAGTIMIVFRDVVAPPVSKVRRRRSGTAVDPAVSDELARSREEIRTLRQETQASAEELQAANEELQSTNEELQSANEELTTSKEESQSMNEELQTINAELRSKLDDLALAQSDMQNLLNSTDIATLFLDNELNVRRFTERITRIIHLRDADVGRPLSDLASTLIYPDLHADAKETLRTLVFCEKQIPTTDGHWYSVRIMPYRTLANVIQGVVITFVDITAAKELEGRLRSSSPGGVESTTSAAVTATSSTHGQ